MSMDRDSAIGLPYDTFYSRDSFPSQSFLIGHDPNTSMITKVAIMRLSQIDIDRHMSVPSGSSPPNFGERDGLPSGSIVHELDSLENITTLTSVFNRARRPLALCLYVNN